MNVPLRLSDPISPPRADIARAAEHGGVPAPHAPRTIEETGLEEQFLLSLLVKSIYRSGLEWPSQMAASLCLPAHLVDHLLTLAADFRLIEPLGQAGARCEAEMRYGITGKGREWALEALEQSQWVGAAPVPLEQFAAQMKAQSITGEILTLERLEAVFRDLTLAPHLMGEIGPAVNSGASVLLYGPPGNGKSSIAEAVCKAYADQVWVPHAIEVDQQIITIYDPTVHRRADAAGQDRNGLRRRADHDPRYLRCRRPVVVTGGELDLSMLDLSYSPTSGIYEAPVQLKATGGVFVVDDLGRQRHTPQQLVNRLIVPLEQRADYLALQTGRKFELPFDTLVIFSTNLPPSQLADGAALRRLRYKILVDKPDPATYRKILHDTAGRSGMAVTEEIEHFILDELYPSQEGAEMHAFHPRFLVDQVRSICVFEGVEPRLSKAALRRAWKNLFPKD